MIVACGENLIDLVQQDSGAYSPVAGGSAVNVAMAVGRLGQTAGYAMPVSRDRLGQLIVDAFASNGVVYLPDVRPARPTGLALVGVGVAGSPEYVFYRHGAADVEVQDQELPDLNQQVVMLHIGGSPCLGNDRCGDRIVSWALRQNCPLSLDPNVRRNLIDDKQRFLRRCEQLLATCSVCKISDEDAEYMYGISDARQIADRLLGLGTALVAVSMGAQGALLATQRCSCEVSAEAPATMQDTVGAGDCYLGMLLTEMQGDNMLTPKACRQATNEHLQRWGKNAAAAAAITCTRTGCKPATRAEVREYLSVS